MRFVIQRVKEASVKADGRLTGQIGYGFLVLVGIGERDTQEIADKMIDKLVKLRIFEDHAGKTNLSLADVNGELLIVSQFTLYADCRHGNRPSFTNAGSPDHANTLYEYILKSVAEKGFRVSCGVFGASMEVSLVNHGPFTILLDSDEIIKN